MIALRQLGGQCIERAQTLRVLLRCAQATELAEFAIVLPFLLVFVIGINDFGGAFLLRQKLAGAAQEGARIAAVQSMSDLTSSTTADTGTINAVRIAVTNALTKANLSTCDLDTATATAGTFTWTYASTGTCSADATLVVSRGVMTPSNSSGSINVVSTQVTLTYPYQWSFNRIIGLLVGGATTSLPNTISVQVQRKNLT
jgi:Flp pilus assembly protein TadG